MKPIRIIEANLQAIADQLSGVNGAATKHVFRASELLQLAGRAENDLTDLLLKKEAPGAQLVAISGETVAKAYSHARNATEVVLERRSSGWFLVQVKARTIGQYQGGESTLILTKVQDQAAVARFRQQYSVSNAPTLPAHAEQAPASAGAGVH
jgi:hypothetical protein